MSQRLLITNSTEKNEWPDCVINPNTEDIEGELIKEWLGCNGSWFLGPWKISIEDFELFLKVQSLIEKVLVDRNKEYPDDVWAFYYEKERIEHPTRQELKEWILKLGFSVDDYFPKNEMIGEAIGNKEEAGEGIKANVEAKIRKRRTNKSSTKKSN